MLDIDIDSKHGILFVRLFGKLTKETRRKLNEEVIELISTVGIQNIVINIQNLNDIDDQGKKALIKCYKMCDKSLLCINPNQTNIIENLNYVTNEISAINLIGV